MSRSDRAYQPGDEIQINGLYQMITGASRSEAEYAWEWLNTWDGRSSMWLAFDDERESDDQLIGQFSLIPTPMSFWGKHYLAGKTENCMSHPQFRGKGMYFFHEKKYFEEAKRRYTLFFTTAGHVARGAPGKVRLKLGYRPFDHWVTYSLWLNKAGLRSEIIQRIPGWLKKISFIGKGLASLMTQVIFAYTTTTIHTGRNSFQLFSETDAPLNEIEKLWKMNATLYGISVDRTAAYLKWRINENPYLSHQYLCYYGEEGLLGYLIFTTEGQAVHVVDILAARKDEHIFVALLDQLKQVSRRAGFTQLKCSTTSKNHLLIHMLKAAKLINFSTIFSFNSIKKQPRSTEFFVYLSEAVRSEHDPWANPSWYITDLLKEGRPYKARLIE